MVQILNKMVHLKYPILEIWFCHKHITQLPPSRLKQSGSIALHKSFSQGKCCTQVCLFVLANQMQASKIKTHDQIFGYLCHLLLFSNAFFKAQMCQKAEEYIPKQVCQHSTAQVIVTGKIRCYRVLYVNFECLFWPIKCMHSKLRFWVHFSHVLLLKCLL